MSLDLALYSAQFWYQSVASEVFRGREGDQRLVSRKQCRKFETICLLTSIPSFTDILYRVCHIVARLL